MRIATQRTVGGPRSRTQPRRGDLMTGTAVAAILVLNGSAAFAQVIPPNSATGLALSSQGVNRGPASNGQPGQAGGDGQGFTVIQQASSRIAVSDSNAVVSASSRGGSGGAGSGVNGAKGDGPAGGAGGQGGDLAFSMDAPPAPGVISTLINTAPQGAALKLVSQGGAGGRGSSTAHRGNGGSGGIGGAGGRITVNIASNPAVPGEWNYLSANGVGIDLRSLGGNSGESGHSQASLADTSVGRVGVVGGAGGAVTANVSLNMAVQGTGLRGVSQGGAGGGGGNAGSDFGKAIGGDGGAGGAGGAVTLSLTGGTIQASGAAKPGTGPSEDEGSTDPGKTVRVNTSVLNAAIQAESRGGAGAKGGTANGNVAQAGSGGAAGAGGPATIVLSTPGIGVYDNLAIGTTGYNTVGALALSVGGDGGNGSSAGGVYSKKGGNGGTGGNGGSAQVLTDGAGSGYARIVTSGDNSDALVAMSIGGGGGYGGSVTGGAAGLSMSLGGYGGNGGDGGMAAVSNGVWSRPTDGSAPTLSQSYVISTTGQYARGLVAQSIGGGGGRGGDASGINLGPLALTIGGDGGKGGLGGTASIMNFGIVQTGGAQSDGVFAQSVGGGGGAGGGAVSTDLGVQLTAAVAVGGNGGKGGNGGFAEADNLKQVITTGSNAHGVFAQSIGGGGGVGGTSLAQTFALNAPNVPSLTLTAAVGGRGGDAGDGGDVRALNTDFIATQGASSDGLLAQSVGGGGGAGGDATASSTAINQSKLTVTVGLGGRGGSSGKGGAVTALNSGLIQTLNNDSKGIEAQSVGGGGGIGGFGATNQGAYEGGGKFSAALTVGVGGDGGSSGDGGAVTVANYVDSSLQPYRTAFGGSALYGAGAIVTRGDDSDGIFAQSVGGGGGAAGDGVGKGGNGQITANIAVGGNGGSGGAGGAVTVRNGAGAITTFGAQSSGVFAQSVGGGGGEGGNAVTGPGDDPQYAYPAYLGTKVGQVLGLPTGSITPVTDGVWDWRQNLNGVKGDIQKLRDLGQAYDTANGPPPPGKGGLSAASLTVDVGGGFGGKGGAGGAGGTVSIDSAGPVWTSGPLSHGLFGQSIGGGGGLGGAALPSTANDQLQVSVVQAALAVGGRGGKGGDGGAVTIANTGSIRTDGDLSFGAFGQSVGGGGGVGGISVPNSGVGATLSIALGGADGATGRGGAVTLSNAGTITTSGDDAIGLMAQSVGGGGGLATVTGQLYDPTTGLSESATEQKLGISISPQLQDPGSNGTGGAVAVTLQSGGRITTAGVNADGVFAQSVGGGGGLFVVDPNDPVSASGGKGPQLYASGTKSSISTQGGAAGDVHVTTQQRTRIATTGDGAAGIVALSLGGGGAVVNGLNGVDLTQASQAAPANRGKAGDSGNVYVDNSSDIVTTGAYAHGIYAQAASGGGGVIGRADGTGAVFRGVSGSGCKSNCGGLVQVTLDAGTITVSGAHAFGAALETEGAAGKSGYAHLVVNANARIFAQGDAAGAVLLNGGDQNVIDNSGVIDASGSQAKMAAVSVGKSFTVNNNRGAVFAGGLSASGKIGAAGADGAPTVTFNNFAGATFDAGDTLDLGGGLLTNHGVMIVGHVAAASQMTGDFVQGADGVLLVDPKAVNPDGVLHIDGKADIAGVVRLSSPLAKTGPVAVLTATDGVTLEPRAATDGEGPIAIDEMVIGDELEVETSADFKGAAADMGKNQRRVAAHLQEAWDSGSAMNGGFDALSTLTTSKDVGAALASLADPAMGAVAASRWEAGQAFSDQLMQGCDEPSDGRICSWGRVQDSHQRAKASADSAGYHADAETLDTGARIALTPRLSLAAGLGLESDALTGDGVASHTTGTTIRAGVAASYRLGDWRLSGAFEAGRGAYDMSRAVSLGASSLTGSSKPTVWDYGATVQAAYEARFGSWSVQPFVGAHLGALNADSDAEEGAGAFDLATVGETRFATSLTAGVDVSSTFALKGGSLALHPYGRVAIEAFGDVDWAPTLRFAGQQGSGFHPVTPLPAQVAKATVGADLAGRKGWSLSVEYGVGAGVGYLDQTGAARLSWRF